MARRQAQAEFAGGGDGGSMADFPGTVAQIQARLERLADQIAELPMEDTGVEARAELDAIRQDLVDPLVDARGQLMSRHGVAAFAEYFSPFSGGERNLNRCWSALTDGHAVVARSSLQNARQSFGDAADAWKRIDAAT
jgi:hypothetical protein